MTTKQTVYIVLLSYKNIYDTLECVKSILNLNSENYKILIVENSEDPFYLNKINDSFIKNNFDFKSINQNELSNFYNEKILLIKANENNGFSAGNNIALKYIIKNSNTIDYVWILNNDTVLKTNTLDILLKSFEKISKTEKLGILGAKLVYYHNKNKIQAIGGNFIKSLLISTPVGEGKDVNTIFHKSIDYVVGASMFTTIEFIKNVGLLSEEYFLFYEELDWIYRSKKYNYTISYCNEAIVYHKEGTSIGSSTSNKKSDFSEIHLFISRKKFVEKFYKKNITFYLSSIALILNRLRKGKIKLSYKLYKIMIGNYEK